MELSTLLFFAGSLACPIIMGTMMWLMVKNMGSQTRSGDSTARSANPKERLAMLRAQQQALEAEIAEVTRLVELEAQREVLLANKALTSSKTNASAAQSVD